MVFGAVRSDYTVSRICYVCIQFGDVAVGVFGFTGTRMAMTMIYSQLVCHVCAVYMSTYYTLLD